VRRFGSQLGGSSLWPSQRELRGNGDAGTRYLLDYVRAGPTGANSRLRAPIDNVDIKEEITVVRKAAQAVQTRMENTDLSRID